MTPTDQERAPDDVRALIERADKIRHGAIKSTDDTTPNVVHDLVVVLADTTDALARLSKGERETTDAETTEWMHEISEHKNALYSLSHDDQARLLRDFVRARENDKISRDFLAVADARIAPSRPPEPAASGEPKPVAYRWDYKLPMVAAEVGWRLSLTVPNISLDQITVEPLYTRPPEGNARVLREALQRLAIREHVRMAEGGGTVPNGFSCELCKAETVSDRASLVHAPTCVLALPADDDQAKRIRDAVEAAYARAELVSLRERDQHANSQAHDQRYQYDTANRIAKAIRALSPADTASKEAEGDKA